ncbi:hypothetical protein [Anaerobaca lacustris]|uniref:Lipoprotein n=1 Tax=Anaerobaca lacustris TaxID=3044600 RepID=A0AAW6U3U5_9BACT|nr:hypothetical protein [Sedimentisphaerales bacterium M17dextr]
MRLQLPMILSSLGACVGIGCLSSSGVGPGGQGDRRLVYALCGLIDDKIRIVEEATS